MATGTKNDLIHCENCGEDYSATYKRCPFCDEAASTRRSNTRGGGYGGGITPTQILGMAISVALIGLAVWIVFSLVAPLIGAGQDDPTPPVDPSPGITAPVDPTADPSADPTVDPSADPTADPSADPSADPTADPTADPSPSTPPAGSVTGITLNSKDFTLSTVGESTRMTATLAPAGASAAVTWATADDSIARVSSDGVVTAVGNGNTVITASAGGVTAECIVRVKNQNTNGGNGTSSTGTAPAGTTYTLSHEDVSIAVAETFTIRLRNADGVAVTWASDNNGVATVDSSGKVTGVAKGTTNIVGTAGGETYSCIVRVK